MNEKSLYVFSNIEKSFSKKKILLEVDITLNQSKCLLLSGKNGSGKSTLLKILAGIEKPDSEYCLDSDKGVAKLGRGKG